MALKKFEKEIKKDPMSFEKTKDKDRPFSPLNFWLMGGCAILIFLGYLFMSGGGSTEPDGFNPDIFSTRRIIVGPLLSFLGFLLMAFAIICPPYKWDLKKFIQKKQQSKENS